MFPKKSGDSDKDVHLRVIQLMWSYQQKKSPETESNLNVDKTSDNKDKEADDNHSENQDKEEHVD